MATVSSPTFTFSGKFIIDTGAYMTVIRTSRIDSIGYSARDMTKPFKTESVIGKEFGYCLKVGKFEVFGKIFEDFEVAALDLPDRYNIDGLIGMNLLNQFNWCMHPQKWVISIHHDPFIGG